MASPEVAPSPASRVADGSPVASELNEMNEMNEMNEDFTAASSSQTAAESSSGPMASEEQTKRPGSRLLALLILVGGLEGADAVLLPCVFFALQRDVGLSLNDLALMSMVQALSGNIASPIWGIMADRGTFKRRTIIIVGCIVQGLITLVLAGVDTMWVMVILRAFNGVMLASLRPIMSGIIADVTSDTNRGKVYGALGIAMNIGTMIGTFIGTNMGRKRILGLQGWRVSFLVVGGASVIVGLVAAAMMPEPPRSCARGGAKGRGLGAVKSELKELWSYFRLPSFCVLILQGCFGSVPWNALGYKTLFFQLEGISDLQTSAIDIASQIAGSLGALLGGAIGDALSKCSRNHGRPITAQISVLAGIPVAWFIFMQAPPHGQAFGYYMGLMIVLGMTATWCGVGVNLPILSEIVAGDRRATIMAWEGTLESSCSAIFGNAMVGFLAQNVFGYDLASAKIESVSGNEENVKALGSALMLVSFCPWVLCFACYSLLHWSYGRDLKRVQQRQQQKQKAADAALASEGPGEIVKPAAIVAEKAEACAQI